MVAIVDVALAATARVNVVQKDACEAMPDAADADTAASNMVHDDADTDAPVVPDAATDRLSVDQNVA